jgi:ABC-type polar amino acid transport system ATPase subunit
LIVSNEPYLARQVADDVILMVDGVWAERAPAEQFFVQPTHEATRRFLEQIMLKGIAGA